MPALRIYFPELIHFSTFKTIYGNKTIFPICFHTLKRCRRFPRKGKYTYCTSIWSFIKKEKKIHIKTEGLYSSKILEFQQYLLELQLVVFQQNTFWGMPQYECRIITYLVAIKHETSTPEKAVFKWRGKGLEYTPQVVLFWGKKDPQKMA